MVGCFASTLVTVGMSIEPLSDDYYFNFISYDHECIWLIPRSWKMASQTQGIQQLLAAEKRAAEKVAEARKSKQFA